MEMGSGGLGCVQLGAAGWVCPATAEGKAQLSCQEWSHSPKLQLLPLHVPKQIKVGRPVQPAPRSWRGAGVPHGGQKCSFYSRGLSYLQKASMSKAAPARAVHTHAVQSQQPQVSVSTPELDAEWRLPCAGAAGPSLPHQQHRQHCLARHESQGSVQSISGATWPS